MDLYDFSLPTRFQVVAFVKERINKLASLHQRSLRKPAITGVGHHNLVYFTLLIGHGCRVV